MIFKREPALWFGLVSAIIQLAIGFGAPITAEQLALIMTAVTAILSFAIRANVYAPVDRAGNPVMAVKKPVDEYGEIAKAYPLKQDSVSMPAEYTRLVEENEKLKKQILGGK